MMDDDDPFEEARMAGVPEPVIEAYVTAMTSEKGAP